jgi:hypothetical protein
LSCLMVYQPLKPRPAAAQEDDQGRDIEAVEVLRGRRPGKSPRPGPGGRYQVRLPANAARAAQSRNSKTGAGRRSRVQESATKAAAPQFPRGKPPKGTAYMTLGVTLWRVRPATEAESKDPKIHTERMEWDGQEHDVVVTRISDESSIMDKDLIQMSVEYLPDSGGAGAMPANQAAYLYVVNREQFGQDLKNARLIFPTRQTYQGDNRLLPGKTVTLPDPRRPFRIKRGNDKGRAQSYETYTIILSPEPLDSELPEQIDKKAMVLTPDVVRSWEQQMGVTEIRGELRNGVGQERTERELAANGDSGETRGSEDPADDLTQDDAEPQTVFRKVAKPGDGMLVIIRVPFTGATAAP